MGIPYDQHEWLDRLGSSRQRGGATLTQENLDLAGPLPVPPMRGGTGSTQEMIEHFQAIETIAIEADDRQLRTALRRKEIRESTGDESDLNDASAEMAFWAQVRDWARTLK